jgi:hypothetical protein
MGDGNATPGRASEAVADSSPPTPDISAAPPPAPPPPSPAPVARGAGEAPGADPLAAFRRGNRERKEREAKQVADACRAIATFWHDGRGEGYAFVRVGRHRECWPVRSRQFERLLLRAYYASFGTMPKREVLLDALHIIEAWALFDGEAREVHNRVAWGADGALYYDLSDPEWRAVRITADGWSIVPEPPIAFRRYSHQAPQVEPVRGGRVSDLLDRLNLSSEDDRLITGSEVVAALIPNIPHVISNAHGSQGAAKTTGQKMLRSIVDPSVTPCLTMPRDSMEMLQLLDHHYAPIFDNVRDLQPWQSDALCRASTGDGSTKRELYTDDDDIIRRFRRVIYINGINVAGESPDYLDRSTLHHVERIVKERRKPEAEVWRDYEAALPRILGAVFDALAGAMRLYPTVAAEVRELPRMADFALWGEAASRAMGNPPGAFLSAYIRSIEARNREAIEASPVGAAILRLLDIGTEEAPGPTDRWEGTAGDLLRVLKPIAEAMGVDLRERSWPKSPRSLGKRLRVIRSNLADEGVRVEFGHSEDRTHRLITISRGAGDTGKNVQNVQTSETDSGGHGHLKMAKTSKTSGEMSGAADGVPPGHLEGVETSGNVRETSGAADSDSGQQDVSDVSAGTSSTPKTCPCGIRGEWEGDLCPLCARDPGRRPKGGRTGPPTPEDPGTAWDLPSPEHQGPVLPRGWRPPP